MKTQGQISVAFALLLTAFCANAALVQVNFIGSIDEVVAGNLNVGDLISGTFTYDNSSQLTWVSSGSSPYSYNFGGALRGLAIAGREVDTRTYNMINQVAYDNSSNQNVTYSTAGFDDDTNLWESIDLSINGQNLYSSPTMLTDFLDFANITSSRFGYTLQMDGPCCSYQERFYGSLLSVETIEAANVPLPTAWLLMLSGLSVLVNRFRRRGITTT